MIFFFRKFYFNDSIKNSFKSWSETCSDVVLMAAIWKMCGIFKNENRSMVKPGMWGKCCKFACQPVE